MIELGLFFLGVIMVYALFAAIIIFLYWKSSR